MDEKITFNISLHEGISEGNYRRYEPGSPISGTVQVIPNEDVNGRSTSVRLRWHTQGRGDLNSSTISEMEIARGPLFKGRPIEKEFNFQLPLEPWSYTGHYINIVWEIMVYVDVSLAVDPKHIQPFIMRPSPPTR